MSSVFTARAPATRGGDTSPPHYLWFQFAFYDERRPLCGYSSKLRSTENVVINQHYQTKTNSIKIQLQLNFTRQNSCYVIWLFAQGPYQNSFVNERRWLKSCRRVSVEGISMQFLKQSELIHDKMTIEIVHCYFNLRRNFVITYVNEQVV